MGKPHALVIPFPAQGHVIPFLELSYCLIERAGFHVTFVNTESTHSQISATLISEKLGQPDEIKLVAIPDGMEPGDNRNNLESLCESMLGSMPSYLEELVSKLNENEAERITCIVADVMMGWSVDVACKMGISGVVLSTNAAGLHALIDKVPELIENGIMDNNGEVVKHQMIRLSPAMPPVNTRYISWINMGEKHSVYHYCVSCTKSARKAKYYLSNSFRESEQAAHELASYLLPIGPLLPATRPGKPVGHFWPEDTTCLEWLDQQPACSVVYVAFGSFTLMNQRQFEELALGLELSGKPFLWVVRPDLMDGSNGTYPESFESRVAGQGKMVSWAPQQKVLAHQSIACFMSHCGWNSTMEGVVNGVPFLCWPYFADQFFNRGYICDVWKIGLGLDRGEDGVITREEVMAKVEAVLRDDGIRASALKLKEVTRRTIVRGTSKQNFDKFIDGILKDQCL